MKNIFQGAEAKLYLDNDKNVIKERFSKKYRHPDLDLKLRRIRTRRESKVIDKVKSIGVACPELIDMNDKEMKIYMSFIPGKMVKEVFDTLEDETDLKKIRSLCFEIGKKLAKMHNNTIIHQDLTTSNMILHSDKNEIYFIDFGLSFFSTKAEDMAVDLHLFKHALESKHHRICDTCFESFLEGYKEKSNEFERVLTRFEKVEMRGRNKGKH